jgi:hypothetical protein
LLNDVAVNGATRTAHRVTVVARNATTLDELRRYLDATGIVASAQREANVGLIDARASAVVLFPDDFEHEGARAFIAELRAARPSALLVIVTSEPQHLAAVVGPDGLSALPVVLPRPSFGWSIVDVIRAHEVS